MKKFLILTGFLGGALVVGTVLLGYYANVHLLPRLPLMAADALRPHGIALTYGTLEPSPVPFSLSLRKVKLGGNRAPYLVEAEQILFRPSIALQLPPFRIAVTINKLSLAENTELSPPSRQPNSEPPSRVLIVLALLRWAEGEVRINGISAPMWDVTDASCSVGFEGIEFYDNQLKQVVLHHTASVKKLSKYSFLQGLKWTGTTLYAPDRLQAPSQTFTLGPIVASGNGTLILSSQKWKGQLTVAETDFSNPTTDMRKAMPDWIKEAKGTLGGNFQFQGVGFGLQSSNIDGSFVAKQLDVFVKKPEIDGRVRVDLTLKVARREKTELDLVAKADLTDTFFQPDPELKKPPGVPFTFDIALKGNEEKFTVPSVSLNFLNASMKGKGEGSLIPSKFIQLDMKLPKTDIAGWEKFFPNYTDLKATGTLEASINFQGPPDTIRQGDLRARMIASKLTIPLWSKLFPFPSLRVQGIASLDSNTDVQWTRGEIRKLATRTDLDFTRGDLKYADSFHKPMGVRSYLSLSVLSGGNRAELKKGTLLLGGLKATAKGSVENFRNPQARIKFDLVPTSPGMLFAFSPDLVARGLSDTRGVVSVRGDFSGPLLKTEPDSKAVPRVSAAVEIRDVDANQAMAAASAKLKDVLSGRVSGVVSLDSSGTTVEEWKRALTGKGSFVLSDGSFKTLKFTQKPLEALQKIPMIGSKITKTEWDEKFQNVRGEFSIHDESAHFSDLVMKGDFFDFTASNCTYRFTGEIGASGNFFPKAPLVSSDIIAILKDASGKPNIPLKIGGTIQSPSISLDGDVIEKRIQGFLERQVAVEKDKLLQGVRKTVEEKARNALGQIFK